MPGTDDLYAARVARAEEHRRRGIDPYGDAFPVTHRAADLPDMAADGPAAPVSVAGRLTAFRLHGGAAFADLLDATGRIQIYVRRDRAPGAFALLGRLDLGDICGARGRLFRSRTGELTLAAEELTMLTKALRPLPDKFHGLRDVEERYRHRHLDLIANPRAREIFRRRAAVLGALRAELARQGYLEAETPVLQPLHGGAAARPFRTHFQALGCPYFLRIATELHLKRLLVGGLDRVYELGRVFRNEGLSSRHNPEFTSLEAYAAFGDWETMMELTADLVRAAAVAATGSLAVAYQGGRIDLAGAWPRLPMAEAVRRAIGVDLLPLDAAAAAGALGVERQGRSWGELLQDAFETHAEDGLTGPVWITDHPLDTSPLARCHRRDPRLAERFELYVAGRELANGFTELTDPVEQRRRFADQQARHGGDPAAHPLDEDFLAALETGMPPAAGMGLGVDRLVMLLTDAPTIKEVILFPALRPV